MANVITITYLNKYVKTLLDCDPVLTDIALKGEVQNFVHHIKSGHYYFSLKDSQATVKAVMFKSDADKMQFIPENGMEVIARCRISLYERDGTFQIYVENMFFDGQGAMEQAFNKLSEKLQNEGLFEIENKKPIPAIPNCIGLVTSKTGAALQDIISVAQRRWPFAKFLLYDAGVQGVTAEKSIIKGIETIDASKECDVIIVARGGGSREDLWTFNSEKLARVVFDCETPIVSGVGHEVDFTIIDLVADIRAATPTAAAEIVLPDIAYEKVKMNNLTNAINTKLFDKLESNYVELEALKVIITDNSPIKNAKFVEDKIYDLSKQNKVSINHILDIYENKILNKAIIIENLNPVKIFSRGYCIAKNGETVVKNLDDLKVNDDINLIFNDFSANCTVKSIEK